MIATGAYLWTLREAIGLSRDDVAHEAGTNNVQIMRIEKGEIDTRGSLLLSVVRAVKGNAEHIAQLLLDASATEEDGRNLAISWINRETTSAIDEFIADVKKDNKVSEALKLIQQLEALDPSSLDRLLGYGQSLLDRNR
ncbi:MULTISPECIES: helix-turn-helix domain-containing protein [Herpetosiphon]|nr:MULTISPECIES: helix-turn-helix transcriptional regulator [Herpetosiphon]MBM7843806.1 transcriptional regulator with XRE-family HTH domain [Herpetosiphon giganteus]